MSCFSFNCPDTVMERAGLCGQRTARPCGCDEKNDSKFAHRDCLGGGTVVGDSRWCGAYGIQADFIARSHCAVEVISTEDIEVVLLVKWTKPDF